MNKDILLKDDKNNNLFPLAHQDYNQHILDEFYFGVNGVLPTNTDLNDLTKTGSYWLSTGNLYAHTPFDDGLISGNYGTLLIYKSNYSTNKVLIQEFIKVGSSKFYVYYRYKDSSGVWKDWLQSGSSGEVTDVQVNGTTILSGGIANFYINSAAGQYGSNNKIATMADIKNAVDNAVPSGSNVEPSMDGIASAGVSNNFSRGDHVHPTDTSRASSSHTHGNITNAGALQTTDISIANGDKLVVTDSSNSNKIARTSLSFDGSTTSQALTKKGTFETFLTSHQSLSAYAKLASPTFTGTPKAPTAAAGTNTTQIATTAFVQAEYATQPNTTTNLAVYTSGRCTRKAGGYRQIGKRVDVDIQITINTTLEANDYWQLIKGFPTPARESALAVCVVGKGAAYSGWISNAGAVTIACGPTNLVSGNVVSFTGTYYTS